MAQSIQHFKADFFKALAHPLRIRILEILCEGNRSVTEIQGILQSEGSTVSQQLAVLRSKNVVYGVKEGTSVVYSLRDPLIKDLLGVARQIFDNHLIDAINLLEEIRSEPMNEQT